MGGGRDSGWPAARHTPRHASQVCERGDLVVELQLRSVSESLSRTASFAVFSGAAGLFVSEAPRTTTSAKIIRRTAPPHTSTVSTPHSHSQVLLRRIGIARLLRLTASAAVRTLGLVAMVIADPTR